MSHAMTRYAVNQCGNRLLFAVLHPDEWEAMADQDEPGEVPAGWWRPKPTDAVPSSEGRGG